MFNSNNPTYQAINNPGIGNYFVKVDVTLPGMSQSVPIGTYDFLVTQNVDISVNIRAEDAGLAKLIVGKPFFIDVSILGIQSPPPEAQTDGIELSININGVDVDAPLTYQDIVSGTTRTYRFIVTSGVSGPITATARVTIKSGAQSGYKSFSSSIDNIEINSNYVNLPIGCIELGTRTINFEVKDSFDNYVSAQNNLKLTDANGVYDISSLVITDDVGKYHFTYDYGVDSYSLTLISYSAEYDKSSQPRSGSFEGSTTCTPNECYDNAQCKLEYGDGYICRNGTCINNDGVPSYLIYIVVGVILLVLIFVGWKFYKSKKSNDIIGGL